MTDISVPCPGCSEPIRFGDRACPSCRRRAPPAARAGIEDRLEAASGDFRELRRHVRLASVTLGIFGALYLGLGLLTYLVAISDEPLLPSRQAAVEARVLLAGNALVGASMLACVLWARRQPARALTTALVVWSAVQWRIIVASGVPAPLFMVTHPMPAVASILASALLVRGALSAYRADQLASALRRAGAPPPVQARPPYR